MANLQISLAPPKVIEIGSFTVTSGVLASYMVTFLLILLALHVRKKSQLVPSRIQIAFEMIMEFFLGMLKSAYGTEKTARRFLPFILTIFLFLLVANQFSVLPIITSFVSTGGPTFKTPTADWNQTIALALIVIGGAHIIAFKTSPLRHINNFIKFEPFLKIKKPADLADALLQFFLGLLDIIGEFSKIISMSARLFGNIFAGEVIILVIASIASFSAYIVPIPFLGLSMFSSLVQAFVFTFLAIFFMAGTVTSVAAPQEGNQS